MRRVPHGKESKGVGVDIELGYSEHQRKYESVGKNDLVGCSGMETLRVRFVGAKKQISDVMFIKGEKDRGTGGSQRRAQHEDRCYLRRMERE